jgi:hypothetical protein
MKSGGNDEECRHGCWFDTGNPSRSPQTGKKNVIGFIIIAACILSAGKQSKAQK